MTRVAGLAEIVLWVRDMDAAMHFYRDQLGLEVISPPGLPNKFLRAGDSGGGVPEMIVLVPHPDRVNEFPREKAKRVLHHLAFRVEAADYAALMGGFEAAGIEVRSGVHPVLKDPPMEVKAVREPRSGPGRSRGRHSASGNG